MLVEEWTSLYMLVRTWMGDKIPTVPLLLPTSRLSWVAVGPDGLRQAYLFRNHTIMIDVERTPYILELCTSGKFQTIFTKKHICSISTLALHKAGLR